MSGAARPVPNAETLEIRALSTRRRQLVEMAAMEKTRLKQAIDEEIVQSHRAAIAALAAERKRIEAKLATRRKRADFQGFGVRHGTGCAAHGKSKARNETGVQPVGLGAPAFGDAQSLDPARIDHAHFETGAGKRAHQSRP
jgi:hypothetical protein